MAKLKRYIEIKIYSHIQFKEINWKTKKCLSMTNNERKIKKKYLGNKMRKFLNNIIN